MDYCISCGHQLAEGAKFCFECGTPVNTPASPQQEQRKTTFDGEIHKCPNCGDIMDAYEAVCESCGYERRGSQTSKVIKEFETRLLSAKTAQDKDEIIRNFTVPNTREDVREFILLAASNIEKGNECLEAWATKLEYVYQKAQIVFAGSEELLKIEQLYIKTSKTLQRKHASQKVDGLGKGCQTFFEGIWGIIKSAAAGVRRLFARLSDLAQKSPIAKQIMLSLACFLLIFLVVIAITSGVIISQENDLAKIVNQVEDYIAAGDYEKAILTAGNIQANSMWPDSKKAKWDGIRNDLLNTIAEKQGTAKPVISVGASSSDFKGMTYTEVEEHLKKRGFTNVLIKSEVNIFMTEGTVKNVTIDGVSEFNSSDTFELDAPIVITYYDGLF